MLNLVRSLSTVGKNIGIRRKTTFYNRQFLFTKGAVLRIILYMYKETNEASRSKPK